MDFRARGPGEGDLNGTWLVHPLDDQLRRTGADDDLDDRSWLRLDVPGHWGRHPDLADHDGPLIYRRRFIHRIPADDERLWLRLDGVVATAEIWMDGTYIGDTTGYFARQRFEVTELMARGDEHLLAIEVAAPGPGGDTNQTSLTGALQSGPLAPPAIRAASGSPSPSTRPARSPSATPDSCVCRPTRTDPNCWSASSWTQQPEVRFASTPRSSGRTARPPVVGPRPTRWPRARTGSNGRSRSTIRSSGGLLPSATSPSTRWRSRSGPRTARSAIAGSGGPACEPSTSTTSSAGQR